MAKGKERGKVGKMVDLEDIYSEKVLELSANMPRTERLKHARRNRERIF